MSKVRIRITTWIGYAISLFFLFLIVRNVSINESVAALYEVKFPLFSASVLIMIVSFVFQAFRWKLLLLSLGNYSVKQTFTSMIIGHFYNAIFPSRIGEFARPYHFSNKTGLQFTTILGSCIIERIFDGFTVILLLVISIFILDIKDADIIRIGPIGAVIYVLAIVFVWIVLRKTSLLLWAVRKLPVKTIQNFIEDKIMELKNGFSLIKNYRHFILVIFWTLSLWSVNVVANFALLKALSLPGPLTGIYAAMLISAATGLAYTIPSAPSSIGVYNYAIIIVLQVISTKSGLELDDKLTNQIIAASFVMYVASIIPDLALGSIAFFKERNYLFHITEKAEKNA